MDCADYAHTVVLASNGACENGEGSRMHGCSDPLSGLIKWLGREEWRGSFEEVLNQHLGLACESAGIGFGEIAEILGDHHFMMLWACAFEDFLTRDCEPDGRNIVDDYLKRRGRKEPVEI